MNKKLIFLLVLLILLIPSGVIFARNLLNTPLDPPLTLVEPAAPEEVEAPADQSSGKVEAPSNSSNNNERTCGNSGVMKILQIGIASHLEVGHLGADSIRLIVVDFDKETVDVFALPADLLVNTPDELVEELDYYAPLNLIYLTAYETAHGNSEKVFTQKATQVLAQTILDEFGFVPDKYININGDVFIELVDTLGGITITLEEAVDGGKLFGEFLAGEQTLDGQETLNFVRILYPSGVGPDYIGRFERQNLVIFALLDAILEPENWDAIPDLVKDIRKMVVTDLSVDQALDLVCMVEEVDGDAKFIEATTDNELIYIDGDGRMIPDLFDIKELIVEIGGD